MGRSEGIQLMGDHMTFGQALGIAPSGPTEFRLEIEGDRFTVAGYSVTDVEGMLKTYRDHLMEMVRLTRDAQSGADAVRYAPASGFEGFAGSDHDGS
jgi:hypothetical protein